MADVSPNQWKMATIGLLIVGATVLITSVVIGRDTKVVPPEEIAQAQETEAKVAEKESTPLPKTVVKTAAAPPNMSTNYCMTYSICATVTEQVL